jgi:hypothetical protein
MLCCHLTLLQSIQALKELEEKMKAEAIQAAAANAASASAAAAAAQAEILAIEQQLQEAKDSATSSQTALEECEKQLKQAALKGNELQKQLQDAEVAAATAAASAATAAQQAKTEHESLQAKLKSCNTQLTATTEQMSAAAAAATLTITELQASCESFRQSTAALQQDLNSTRESLSSAEATAAAASARCDALQSELSSTSTSLAQALSRAEVEAARAQELEAKAADVDVLRGELEESRSQILVVQKKSADSIRQLQREVARQKSHTDSTGGAVVAGAMSAGQGAELSPAHPASIKITDLEAQVAMLKEELERKKRMLSEIADGGIGSSVMLRGAQAVSSGSGSPAPAHKEDSGDKGVGSKLMSGFKKGGMAALTLGGLIPHKSSPKPDVVSHAIDQEKMNSMEAMLEETVMTNNKLQRELIKVHSKTQTRALFDTHTQSPHSLQMEDEVQQLRAQLKEAAAAPASQQQRVNAASSSRTSGATDDFFSLADEGGGQVALGNSAGFGNAAMAAQSSKAKLGEGTQGKSAAAAGAIIAADGNDDDDDNVAPSPASK